MDIRKNIYEFILNSKEYKKYNNQKKIISIFLSIISLISILIILLSFLFLNEIKTYLMISGFSIFFIFFIISFISLNFFIQKFKDGIYEKINKNIEIFLKNEKRIIIEKRIKEINYRKSLISIVTDDIYEKIKVNL